jgi:hypothetical protein
MTSSGTCFVILAHTDPDMVGRVINALRGADIFLHCDARTPDDVARAMVPANARRVHLLPRRRTALASWGLVEAELAGLEAALSHSSAEQIAVMSGSCYPLASLEAIETALASNRNRSFFELHEIPRMGWHAPWAQDGGMWRFEHRFLTVNGVRINVGGRPIPIWPRRVPSDLMLHGGAQWKVYARKHASALLSALNDRPALRRYWRGVFIPDESCAASILKSPAIVGDVATEVLNHPLWLIRWPDGRAVPHPCWLTLEDSELITAAAHGGKLFARKIGSSESELLQFIDETLRR